MTSYTLCFITFAVIAGATGVVSQTPVLSPSGPTFVDENEQLVLTTTYQMSARVPLLMEWVKNNNTQFLQLLVSRCQSINPPLPTGYSTTCTKTGTTYTFTLTVASINKTDEGQTWQSDITNNRGTERSLELLTLRIRVPIVSVTLTTQTAITVLEGTQITFICDTSESNPSSTITWYKDQNTATTTDDQEITTGVTTSDVHLDSGTITRGTLRYTPSRQDNGWSVFCYASNVGPLFTSRKSALTVHYPPTITSIPDNSIVAGQGLSQTCEVLSGNPTAYTYRWTRGGSSLKQSQRTLTLPSVQTTDVATYTCTVQNTMTPTGLAQRQGQDTESFVLDVLSPPTTPTFRYKNQAVSGNTLSFIYNTPYDSLTCDSKGNPSPYYGWRRHSSSGVLSTSQDLTLTTIQRDEGGVYKCIAYNTLSPSYGSGGGSKSRTTTITLNVLYPPSILPISPKRVIEGSLLSIPCATTAGNPSQTTYTWTRSGDNSWRRTSQTMSTQRATRTDTRVYTCKAQNTMVPTKPNGQQPGVDTKTVQVTIEYTPDVTVTTTNTTVNATNVDIVCSPFGVPNTYTYQPWTQHWSPGVEILHTPALGNSPTLQLTQLSYQHSGIYTCTAGNGVLASNNPGAGRGNVYLLVKSQPIVTEPLYNNGDHHKLSIALKTTSSLVLKYYSNAGDTTVTVNSKIGGNIGANVFTVGALTPTNVQLPVFSQRVTAPGMTTTLTFTIREQQQYGQYEVVLKNENDLPQTFFKLDVVPKQPPEVPSHMTSVNVTQTTASLTWVRGFHGGSNQTFVVQLSTDTIQWTNKTFVDDGQNDSNIVVLVTVDGLIPGTKYYVRVFAVNKEGHNDEYSNVNNFNTQIVSHVTEDNTSSLGGIIGGTIAAVVVIVLVVVAVVLSRKYECQKKNAKPQSTEESRHQYENVTEGNIDNVHIYNASEQVSYYNIGRESEPVPSTYESLSDREPTPNMYSSLQNIEMAPIRNIASNPAVSEPIQSPYESLTDRETDPNMYSSLDNTESSPDGKNALNPEQEYINLKV